MLALMRLVFGLAGCATPRGGSYCAAAQRPFQWRSDADPSPALRGSGGRDLGLAMPVIISVKTSAYQALPAILCVSVGGRLVRSGVAA